MRHDITTEEQQAIENGKRKARLTIEELRKKINEGKKQKHLKKEVSA